MRKFSQLLVAALLSLVSVTANAQIINNLAVTFPVPPTISTGASGAALITAQTTAPTVASCGTGTPTVAGTDVDGVITTGGGSPTSCQLVFNSTHSSTPVCTANVGSGVGVVTVTGATTAHVTFALSATATSINYICLQ